MIIDSGKKKGIEVFFHVAAWILVFSSPLYMLRDLVLNDFEVNYFAFFFMHIIIMMVFYIDYLVLIPKLLFKSKTFLFIALNLIIFVLSICSILFFHTRNKPPFHPKDNVELVIQKQGEDVSSREDAGQINVREEIENSPKYGPRPEGPEGHKRPDFGKMGIFHDGLLLFLVIIISILLRFTQRWFASIEERRELERSKMAVELKNLKNQLNPHFLFNTLNNIYALIGISQDKAQQAVFDLSKLLRYVLYEGDSPFVTLDKEVEFLLNYIKLMKLRLSSNVDVKTSFELGDYGNSNIAQLLFMSLVENAFKHGVSMTNPSFVEITLTVKENKQLNFVVKNSCFPKTKTDKSGSGIGIENMKRRLELLYPGDYVYHTTIEGNTYTAFLQLNLK